jgi:hypothetical protein
MKRFIIALSALLSLFALAFSGCSAIFHEVPMSNSIEKSYDFKDFTDVELADAFQFEIKQADNYSVVVSTKDEDLKYLDVYKSGNTLHVGRKVGLYNHTDNAVMIALPKLNNLTVSGSCTGTAAGFDSTGNLEITVSGASSLHMNIKAGQTGMDVSGSSYISGDLTAADTRIKLAGASRMYMNLKTGKTWIDLSGSSGAFGNIQALDSQFKLSGASDCDLTGSTGDALIEAYGSSQMNSPDLKLKNADIILEGASHAEIYAEGVLNIDLSGSSRLDYKGNAQVGRTNMSEDSKLNHR